ncbi:MAG: flagellar basal body rod protein FlgC [Nevskiaceae bacterium]|nr:MAG: flagellar basal body rod protein FlgC [Nevskiaceae bacterium]TBR75146.1 MAG: flagellar basal body rod protein FlgC [Nevskiaceae bacterium]
MSSAYGDLLAISAAGMRVERTRLEVASDNLANTNAVTGRGGEPFRPLRVIVHADAAEASPPADGAMARSIDPMALQGPSAVDVVPVATEPSVQYDPGNPLADGHGMVQVSQINPVEEMMTMMSAVRAYEANVRAMNAAKSIALRALEIGSTSA